MKNLTTAFLKHIGDYMLIETPLAWADVCLIFGGSQADHLANHAADLYHQGYFKQIVVSGGVRTPDGRLEADHLRDVLMARGVPSDSIIVEDKAQNTGENVIFSKALVDQKIGLGNIQSIIAIGQIHGSRRFLMTLERHWPQVVKMFTTPNYYPVPRNLWYTDPVFKRDVLREYAKIPGYKTRGFIREIDMKKICQAIVRQQKPPRPPACG